MKAFFARRAALVGAALSLALAVPRTAEAVGDPDLDWQTIETAHFRVHHPTTLTPLAERVARLSEAIHERLTVALGNRPRSITEVVITDDVDSANGSATALPFNTVRLYATAPEDLSPLGDYDDWLLDLITHEHTHILHLDNISGLPAIANAILGKSYAPNQVQPRWIIEGLATVYESRESSAGRMRSALFDMFLRADVLDDNIARLDQMSSTSMRWPQGNIWYLYGSRFLGWITDVYGGHTMTAVAADYGQNVIPWGINRSMRRATGRTYEELFEGFKDHLRLKYAAQVRAIEAKGLREGVRLTHHGRNVLYPRFVPRNARATDADELVYYRDDYNVREGIYRARFKPRHDAFEEDAKLVARTRGTSPSAFSPAGDHFHQSNGPFKIVYRRDDLYRVENGKTAPRGDEAARHRLTTGLRAGAPDISPDGRRITFTVNTKGTTFLQIADLDPEGHIQNRRDLVPSARFEQAYTPRFSPDGRSIAYSAWTTGGYRDIRVVDVATGSFENITHDRAIEANPTWSSDGKTLYFSSDRSGVPNIYAYDVASRALKQVTNVRVGALQPAVSPDDKTLVYVGYTSKGYDLYAMPLDPARFLDAPPAPTDRPDPPPEPERVLMRKVPYRALSTLAPRNYGVAFGPGNYSQNALTLSTFGADVAGFHEFQAEMIADFAAPAPRVNLDYSYRRLPVDLGIRFYYAVSPRYQGYRSNGRDVPYDERGIGLSSSMVYRMPGEFTDQSVSFSYSFTGFRGDLPGQTQPDPYATRTRLPVGGTIGTVRAAYSFSNVEGSLDSAGSIRGYSMRLAVEYAGPVTGSDFTLQTAETSIAGYIPMPWRGLHTLALRVAGGIAAGSYPRDGFFFVGGYDLDNVSLVDTVTTGIYDGSFVLRGYAPGSASGRAYVLSNAEYRFPIVKPDWGLSTLPFFIRRLDGNVFVDYGGAFDKLTRDDVSFLSNGALIDAPKLHTSVGAELWLGLSLGYYLNTQLRLGYAYGFSGKAIPGGQAYFVASSAF
ncbi:BamA/TamA family outer membrane protein [Polyangium mundeleinium]|uniref:BamA/TamA family outer membrane protein n=1 Tax=Polyangium mundeleinium TaxID=2995306 RepID=A0ABT5F6V3_9BACT|nr:BamA/TamA family outer membrane protein [Polyangium mundeleinium]MDC0749841.1 BamA/TamA family outer membrane protein [Polyangium mundeleinium]